MICKTQVLYQIFSLFLTPPIVRFMKSFFKGVNLTRNKGVSLAGFYTKFSELFHKGNKKPLYAFLIAQLFNVLVTLAIAYILF